MTITQMAKALVAVREGQVYVGVGRRDWEGSPSLEVGLGHGWGEE